jgi:hypothetical protein
MNALQRLEGAVIELVAGTGDLHVRLESAFVKHLRHIRPGELPAELSNQLQSIIQRYRATEANTKASKPHPLSEAQAKKLATDIFHLSCAVSQGLYH